MKIYFTFSDAGFAKVVAGPLQNFGHDILTKHLLENAAKEKMLSIYWRYERNVRLIKDCDVVIALLSTKNTLDPQSERYFEIGYEVSYALAAGKTVYIFYGKDNEDMPVSVTGNTSPNCIKVPYANEEDLNQFLYDNFRIVVMKIGE